ncbi:hypothetical protein I3271_01550 [Photobacterium leiognathi]|uniref:hypothetical protein n=1 Tax=Photobacterium leiognathi TaxID=553611 RepID=UPI001EE06495|nr:hypothetical protein [Photobacterium leiognathi]MCG3883364.1 hypothetical protein [Photobacterium leiognathi]
MTINSLKASINDDQFVVSMKGTTKGKNADYTVNTTFTAEAKGFISVNYGEGAVRLRSPIVTLKGAPEINTMIKDNYIKTIQSALEDVSDYIFSSTPMFALTKDQVNQIGLSDDSVIETLVDDGLISIRTMK